MPAGASSRGARGGSPAMRIPSSPGVDPALIQEAQRTGFQPVKLESRTSRPRESVLPAARINREADQQQLSVSPRTSPKVHGFPWFAPRCRESANSSPRRKLAHPN